MREKLFAFTLTCLVFHCASLAQSPKIVTEKDYQRAAALLNDNAAKLIDNTAYKTMWLPDNRLVYLSLEPDRVEYRLFNPADKKTTVLSDMAEKLSSLPGNDDSSDEEVMSPDGKYSAFIRNWNLWIRETGSGKEKALTTPME